MAQAFCETDEKDLQKKKGVTKTGNNKQHNHNKDDGHDHEEDDEHDHGEQESTGWKSHWPLLLALAILLGMLVLEFGFKYKPAFPIDMIVYVVAFFLAGYNVLYMTFRKAKRLDFFY